ncbi:dityrosine synthesis enzyme [Cymbomonas tetramitiformis]|uniref:Dityrosine synthesis enzyme n=1 Tax=Cymbomonas tetramitiformis TaxID=36881 RepID=A0AAE0H314_9CHLO|nr:dityrosine synthesis enzyme [Cymbomonas tetramitiformis]
MASTLSTSARGLAVVSKVKSQNKANSTNSVVRTQAKAVKACSSKHVAFGGSHKRALTERASSIKASSHKRLAVHCNSAVVQAAAAAEPPAEWKGANLKSLGISVACGALIWFIPPPAGVEIMAWKLLAIFVATIVGIITQPVPLGAVAMIGLGAAMVLKVLPFTAAFSAFATEIPWLIAVAFFLARGFIKTGLGNRIAYMIVSAFGSTTLGLTYSLVFAEALLAPAIPSVAARAGGIFLPLCKALCGACGSNAGDGTERKMGSYLMFTMFQMSTISSSMFITAMAANPLSVNLAAAAIGQTISWGQWALAASVPGFLTLLLAPLVLYILYPPEQKESPEAPKKAKEELAKLGPMTTDEKIMGGALLVTVFLWIAGGSFGIGSVAAALVGLTILLVTGVVTWKECLAEGPAWDTLTWFAALIAMAAYLNKYGLIKWFSGQVVNVVGGLGLAWQPAFLIALVIYFYAHYMFASGAAHIGAMYTAFLSVAVACGSPPLVAALALGIMSNIMGCTTHYGIGSAPPYFGAGYVDLPKWWTLGGIMSAFYLALWIPVCSVWWKVIGLY